MPNLLMELDSSGIKSTSEIATPLQSASALEELNQKRNLLAAGEDEELPTQGEGSRGQGEPRPSQALCPCPAKSLSLERSQSSPPTAAPGKGFTNSSPNSKWFQTLDAEQPTPSAPPLLAACKVKAFHSIHKELPPFSLSFECCAWSGATYTGNT